MPRDGTATSTRILDAAQTLMERYVEADLGLLRAGLVAVEPITDPVDRALDFARHFERWAEELLHEDSACLCVAALSERDLLEGPVCDAVLRAVTTYSSGRAGCSAMPASRWRAPAC